MDNSKDTLTQTGGGTDQHASDKDGYAPLYLAVAKGDIAAVQTLIDAGVNVIEADQGHPLLHMLQFISKDAPALIELLHKHGANINAQYKGTDESLGGTTPLHRAIISTTTVSSPPVAVFDKLLALGAATNIADANGNHAIHTAAHCKRSSFIGKLLTSKVDINVRNTKGQTALHIAVMANSLPTVEFLLKNGANLEVQDESGKTPFALANNETTESIVTLLVRCGAKTERPDLDHYSNRQLRAFIAATHESLWESFLEAIADTKAWLIHRMLDMHQSLQVQCELGRNAYGMEILSYAVAHGSFEILKILLEKGKCDPKKLEEEGELVLHQAIDNRYEPGILTYLLTTNAKRFINAPNINGTPLQHAIQIGDPEAVKTLLANGADVNKAIPTAVSLYDSTPLALAVCYWSKEKEKEKDNEKKEEYKKIIDTILLRDDVELNTSYNNSYEGDILSYAAKNGDVALVKRALAAGVNVDQQAISRKRALHCAIKYSQSEKKISNGLANLLGDDNSSSSATQNLAEFKSDIQRMADVSRSQQSCEIIELLLGQNADIHYQIDNARDKGSYLHYAAKYGSAEVVKLLLERGCQKYINHGTVDKQPYLPLVKAMERDSQEVAMVLIEAGANINSTYCYKGNDFDYIEPVIHGAAVKGWAEAADLLIKKGASIGPIIDGENELLTITKDEATKKVIKDRMDVLLCLQSIRDDIKNGRNANLELKLNTLKSASRLGVDDTNNNEKTLLHDAVISNNSRAVQLLCDLGANTQLVNKDKLLLIQSCAQSIAQQHDRYDGLAALLAKTIEQSKGAHNITNLQLLFHAARNKNHKALLWLLQQPGIDIFERNAKGLTVMQEICCNPKQYTPEIFKALLIVEGHLRENAVQQLTAPSSSAADELGMSALEMLIKHTPPEDRETPINNGTFRRHTRVFDTLDEVLSYHDLADEHGRTVLHYAAMHGKSGCIERLLQVPGINVNVKDASGLTPLHYIAIQQKPYQIPSDYFNECMQQLLAAPGIDVNIQDNYGRTPLHAAIIHGCNAYCNQLFAAGADISIQDNDGRTPLHHACATSNLGMVRGLMENYEASQIIARDKTGKLAIAHTVPTDPNTPAIRALFNKHALEMRQREMYALIACSIPIGTLCGLGSVFLDAALTSVPELSASAFLPYVSVLTAMATALVPGLACAFGLHQRHKHHAQVGGVEHGLQLDKLGMTCIWLFPVSCGTALSITLLLASQVQAQWEREVIMVTIGFLLPAVILAGVAYGQTSNHIGDAWSGL